MDDLLKKLRGPVGAGMTGESALAMADAADEIERLRVLVHAAYREGFSDRDDARMTGDYAADVHDAWVKSVVRSSLGTKEPKEGMIDSSHHLVGKTVETPEGVCVVLAVHHGPIETALWLIKEGGCLGYMYRSCSIHDAQTTEARSDE